MNQKTLATVVLPAWLYLSPAPAISDTGISAVKRDIDNLAKIVMKETSTKNGSGNMFLNNQGNWYFEKLERGISLNDMEARQGEEGRNFDTGYCYNLRFVKDGTYYSIILITDQNKKPVKMISRLRSLPGQNGTGQVQRYYGDFGLDGINPRQGDVAEFNEQCVDLSSAKKMRRANEQYQRDLTEILTNYSPNLRLDQKVYQKSY